MCAFALHKKTSRTSSETRRQRLPLHMREPRNGQVSVHRCYIETTDVFRARGMVAFHLCATSSRTIIYAKLLTTLLQVVVACVCPVCICVSITLTAWSNGALYYRTQWHVFLTQPKSHIFCHSGTNRSVTRVSPGMISHRDSSSSLAFSLDEMTHHVMTYNCLLVCVCVYL